MKRKNVFFKAGILLLSLLLLPGMIRVWGDFEFDGYADSYAIAVTYAWNDQGHSIR